MKQRITGIVAVCALGVAAGAATRAEGLPDPTRPATLNISAAPVEASEPELQLEAIMRSGERHLAIVNGRLVRVGDRVGTALIRDIDADGLRYAIAGRERVAKLPGATLKVRRNRTEVTP